MSDIKKTIKHVYTFETLSQLKLLPGHSGKLKQIGEKDNQYFFSVRGGEDSQSFILAIEAESFESKYFPINHQIKGSILAYFPNQNFILYKANQRLHYFNTQTQTALDFNISPSFAVPLPILDGTLLINKQKNVFVFLHQGQKVIPAQTLQRILANYSYIAQCSYILDADNKIYFALACFLPQFKQYHVLLLTLVKESENLQQREVQYNFKLLDLYKLKENQQVNKIQLIHNAEELLLVYQGSRIKKMTLNKEGKDQKLYRRLELKAKHNLNLFQVKQIILLQNQKDCLIRDKSDNTFIVNLTKNKMELQNPNILLKSQPGGTLLCYSNQIFSVDYDEIDKTKINLSGIIKLRTEEMINWLMEEKQQFHLAQTLMRISGQGQFSFLQYRLKQSGYQDEQLLRQFLEFEFDSSDILYSILTQQPIQSINSLKNITKKCIQLTLKEENKAQQLQQLLQALKRIKLFEELGELISAQLQIREFLFELSIEDIIARVARLEQDPVDSLQQVFSVLEDEIIQNYYSVMQNLPLEQLDPYFLLEYLPPGFSQKRQPFWLRFEQLLSSSSSSSEQKQEILQILTDSQIYQEIAVEYIYSLNQPGKALRILQEAVQNRMIENLTKVALAAVEHTLMSSLDSRLDQEKRVADLFGLHLNLEDSVKSIEAYFSSGKWIFTMDQQLYKRYLGEIKYFLIELIGVDQSPMLSHMLEFHSSSSLLFLRDQDIAQLTLDIIYSKLNTSHGDQVQSYFRKLQELTLSDHQHNFLNNYLSEHLLIQREVAAPYNLDISFKTLLRLQMSAKQGDQHVDDMQKICSQMIEQVINKSRGLFDQMLSFSRSKTSGNLDQRWIKLLQDLTKFRDLLGFSDQQVDVYQKFLSKLLESKVTQSIEQLIKSQIIPVEEIQASILKYLQDQFNQCQKQNFYAFFSNSKAFIDLLIQYDKEPHIYLAKLKQEQKILEAAFFLQQNNLLVNELSFAQIRADFLQERLVDRVLQVHGFMEYPSQFSILLELQQIIDESLQNQVIVKVFKHLNNLKYFERADQMPTYLNKMLYELILLRSLEDHSWVQELSFAIIKIVRALVGIKDKEQLRKDLLSFMIKAFSQFNSNAEYDIYFESCQTMAKQINKKNGNDFGQQLQNCLDNGLDSKAKHMLRQYKDGLIKKLDNVQILLALLQETTYNYYQVKKLARLIEVQDKTIEKIKIIKKKGRSDFYSLLQDENAFEQLQAQRKQVKEEVKGVLSQESPMLKLVSAKETEEINTILELNYMQSWDSTIDLGLLLSEMQKLKIQNLPLEVYQALFDKLDILQQEREEVQGLKKAIEFSPECPLNYMLFMQDLLMFENESEQEFFERSLKIGLFPSVQSEIISDMRKAVTATNFFKLSQVLDQINPPRFTKLLAVAFYINKLYLHHEHYWSIKHLKKEEIDGLFYSFMEKDVILETIEDPQIFQEINKQYKEFIKKELGDEVNIDNIILS